MGISPDIWGPSTWTFLHLIVLSEPEILDTSRLGYYKTLFTVLQELLPCQKCRNHLRENMGKLKDLTSIQSKRELFDWTVELHNLVNQITNKRTYDLEEAFQLWNDIAHGKRNLYNIPCTTSTWKYATWILLLLLLGMIYLTFSSRAGGLRKK